MDGFEAAAVAAERGEHYGGQVGGGKRRDRGAFGAADAGGLREVRQRLRRVVSVGRRPSEPKRRDGYAVCLGGSVADLLGEPFGQPVASYASGSDVSVSMRSVIGGSLANTEMLLMSGPVHAGAGRGGQGWF